MGNNKQDQVKNSSNGDELLETILSEYKDGYHKK